VRPLKEEWPSLEEEFWLTGRVGADCVPADLVFWLPLGVVGVDVGGL